MNESTNKFLSAVRPFFVSFLKTLLKVSGFKAWIIGVLAKEFYDDIAVPLIRAGVVEVGYQFDVINGKKMIRKLEEAESAQEYDDATDDVLGGS